MAAPQRPLLRWIDKRSGTCRTLLCVRVRVVCVCVCECVGGKMSGFQSLIFNLSVFNQMNWLLLVQTGNQSQWGTPITGSVSVTHTNVSDTCVYFFCSYLNRNIYLSLFYKWHIAHSMFVWAFMYVCVCVCLCEVWKGVPHIQTLSTDLFDSLLMSLTCRKIAQSLTLIARARERER